LRVFVAGASGFIGAHVAGALLGDGWTVIGGARNVTSAQRVLPGVEWIGIDFGRDTDPEVWRMRLEGCDALVNCVGILQSGWRDRSKRIHVDATIALFRGAQLAGVRRMVHISALGVDTAGVTDFARDKAAADAVLQTIDGTIILRPSLVYARANYGGTALMRALAGLPGIVPVPSAEIAFDPIHADDLAAIVVRCLDQPGDAHGIFEVGGPERLTLREIVNTQRAWLGFGRARFVRIPDWLLAVTLTLGDAAGWLGNPGPMRSTTLAQARAMPPAGASAIIALTGVRPRTMREALASTPASSADRLEARLGFALPALRIALGLFWIVSGLIALLPGPFKNAKAIAEVAGISPDLSGSLIVLAALADIVLGVPMLIGIAVRRVALAQATLSTAYLVVLSILLPALWLDPLGPLAKTVPIIFVTLLVAAAAGERR
jgi:uncharacterized protein YbjT (DUF2867 family)